MAEAKQQDSWLQTASLMALIYNRTRFGAKDKVKKPSDFMPDMRQSPKRGGLPWSADERKLLAKRAGFKVEDAKR